MAKVPGFAKALAGASPTSADFPGKNTTTMILPAVTDQASFAHAPEFFNSLLVRLSLAAFTDWNGFIWPHTMPVQR